MTKASVMKMMLTMTRMLPKCSRTTMFVAMFSTILSLLLIRHVESFTPVGSSCVSSNSRKMMITGRRPNNCHKTTRLNNNNNNAKGGDSKGFEVNVDVPPSNSGVSCTLKFGSILSVPSEIVEVRYKLPFGLNVEPRKNFAVVTKDGTDPAAGDGTKEQVGDVLRYTSQWTMGLPEGDGLAATAGFFSGGGVTWRCTMFDVMKARDWNRVVEALTSNVPARTDEVVMLFERPLEPPPELQ